MDLARFLALVRTRTLHFSRSDLHKDKFEGALTQQTVVYQLPFLDGDSRVIVLGEPGLEGTWPEGVLCGVMAISDAEVNFPTGLVRAPEPLATAARSDLEKRRRSLYVNCWHANTHESAAMWELYAKGGAGIAIKTSFTRLKESFASDNDHPVSIGKVRYRDYTTEAINAGTPLFGLITTKRLSYAHEQEVRAIFHASDAGDRYRSSEKVDDFVEGGVDIAVNLDRLIERIVVAPQAPSWFKEQVHGVAQDYGLTEKKVVTSSLDDRPLW
jgi:hypothetical protein